MIISHKNRFIFIKPRKVAGTTIELKLSPFLYSGDLATPIEPEEEPLRQLNPGVIVAKIRGKSTFGLPRKLRDHSTLQKAFSILTPEIQNYFVISACRNPWDRAVSQFFWSYRKTNIFAEDFKTQKNQFTKFVKKYGPKTWLDAFYGRKRQRRLDSSHLYTINQRLHINFVIRFEKLEEDFSNLVETLGLSTIEPKSTIFTKSTFRPRAAKRWQDFYDRNTIDLVESCCWKEIKCFNYNFEGNTNPRGGLLENLPV